MEGKFFLSDQKLRKQARAEITMDIQAPGNHGRQARAMIKKVRVCRKATGKGMNRKAMKMSPCTSRDRKPSMPLIKPF